MSKEEISREVRGLTTDEQRALCTEILDRLMWRQPRTCQGRGETVAKRYARYRRAMRTATGIDIETPSREHRFVWARNIVTFQLCLDGLCVTQIGRLMGMHHASVVHQRDSVRTMLDLPTQYAREIDVYNRFKTLIAK